MYQKMSWLVITRPENVLIFDRFLSHSNPDLVNFLVTQLCNVNIVKWNSLYKLIWTDIWRLTLEKSISNMNIAKRNLLRSTMWTDILQFTQAQEKSLSNVNYVKWKSLRKATWKNIFQFTHNKTFDEWNSFNNNHISIPVYLLHSDKFLSQHLCDHIGN